MDVTAGAAQHGSRVACAVEPNRGHSPILALASLLAVARGSPSAAPLRHNPRFREASRIGHGLHGPQGPGGRRGARAWTGLHRPYSPRKPALPDRPFPSPVFLAFVEDGGSAHRKGRNGPGSAEDSEGQMSLRLCLCPINLPSLPIGREQIPVKPRRLSFTVIVQVGRLL